MLKNYALTAFRSMLRNKGVTLISLAGFATGLSCALLIFLYVQFELSYDDFHHKRNDIYRVLVEGTPKQGIDSVVYHSSVVHDFVPTVLTSFSFIRHAARLSPQTAYVKQDNQMIEENHFYLTEPSLFDVFDFSIQAGSAKQALSIDNSILISRGIKEKYFGSRDPVDQKLKVTLFNGIPFTFTITGVLSDIPKNSSLKIDFLSAVPFDTVKKILPEGKPFYTYSYIKFKWQDGFKRNAKGYKPVIWTPTLLTIVDDFKKKIGNLKLEDNLSDRYFQNWQFTLEPLKPELFGKKRTFVPLTPEFDRPMEKRSMLLVLFLSGSGTLILLVSCIDVITLSIARSTGRAKEIAVRKVMGADQWQLFFQFLIESVFLSLLSLFLAVSMVELVLPYFNMLVHQDLSIAYLKNAGYLFAMGVIVLLTGLLSGLYPALFLSAFQPVETLKGESLLFSKKLRRVLMIFQITVSVSIFILSLLFIQETEYLKKKPLGFNGKEIILFKLDDPALKDTYSRFKSSLLSLPGVDRVASSGLAAWKFGTPVTAAFKCLETKTSVQATVMTVDSDYLRVYEIPIIQGQDFPENADNMNLCMINTAAKNSFQFNRLSGGKSLLERQVTRQVIGVTENFHFQYPVKAVSPLVMVLADNVNGMKRSYVSVRLFPGHHKETIEDIRKTIDRFFPGTRFEFDYVDREIENMHWEKNNAWKKSLVLSTGICIFLACLGLYGFAEYEIDRKRKEIGIRKALGATRFQIAGLFIRRFVGITLVANLIAWPVSFLSTRWVLSNIGYPYEIGLSVPIFALVALATLFLTVLTISLQTAKAASMDPQNALKDE